MENQINKNVEHWHGKRAYAGRDRDYVMVGLGRYI